MSSYDVINLKVKAYQTLSWKKRRPVINESEIKDSTSYIHQANILYGCLLKLLRLETAIKEHKYKYIEVVFFKKVSELTDYFNFLKNNHGIECVNLMHTKNSVFFKINDFRLFKDYLTKNIQELLKYTKGEIDKKTFIDKRIILWHSFNLNTEDFKDNITGYIRSYKNIKLEYFSIDHDIEKKIKTISTYYSNINVDIINNTIDISEISDPNQIEVKEFIRKIISEDDILYIRLDSFISTEDTAQGLKNVVNIKIQHTTDPLPVVAVIDTGIKKTLLTGDYLISEGLDYTNSDPLKGDPFKDEREHGTLVANEIIYGGNIYDYLANGHISKIDRLFPTARVFSVKVLGKEEQGVIEYQKILDINGEFSKAIRNYNIKVINLSINEITQKDFFSGYISKNASLIDKFSSELGVLFVICTGNIRREEHEALVKKYPNLEFYNGNFHGVSGDPIDKLVNIASPADFISGITVGGGYLHSDATKRNREECFSTSLFSRGFLGEKKYAKPDILSLGSGDRGIYENKGKYEIDYGIKYATFCSGLDETQLKLDVGTSLSTPRVSRALAIGAFKYPNFSVETIKGLFLHNLKHCSTNKNFIIDKSGAYIVGKYIDIAKYFGGMGLHNGADEIKLFSDDDNKVTYIIEGKVKSKNIIQYKVPIIKLLGKNTKSTKHNKLKLKLSICIMPTNNVGQYKEISLDDANEFYIAGAIHKVGFDIVKNNLCQSKKKGIKDILLNWTLDYYKVYNKTYSESEVNILKHDLVSLLGDDDYVTLSVRGVNKININEEKSFSAIFSIEDLGATNQIRNHINIKLST